MRRWGESPPWRGAAFNRCKTASMIARTIVARFYVLQQALRALISSFRHLGCLRGLCRLFYRRGLRLLFHRNGLFAFPASEIVEFRATDVALALDFNFGDSR